MSRAGPKHVAVVGAGASGTLQALHLQRAGARVTLIERGERPGRGVAYGTKRPEHLLNVPARRMSAYADELGHFSRWWADRTDNAATEEDYAPRMVFGDYLTELLDAAEIPLVQGEAVDVADGAVLLADGRTLTADAVVLAPGNFPPATPRGIDTAALGGIWVDDPWSGALEGLGPKDVVFLVGTGLTAVDVALTLEATGFRGRIVALSRRGLAPRVHGLREPMVAAREDLVPSCIAMLKRVRARSGEVGWRSAVQELRTVTQWLWAKADMMERRRFLRHLRPWWDVHRHKLAPAIGATIELMQAEARLAVTAGRVLSITPVEGGAEIRFRPRGQQRDEQVRAARVVNCTGPDMDIGRAGEPLLDALLARGAIRRDALEIGVDVDEDCRAIGAAGQASETLSVIGPVTRGTFWESVAVPDIRLQAARVAARLCGQGWDTYAFREKVRVPFQITIRNRAPPPSRSPTSIAPRWASTTWRARLRPTPVPSCLVVKKGRKMSCLSPSGTPGPLSATSICARPERVREKLSQTCGASAWPLAAWPALRIRLISTWLIRSGSASSVGRPSTARVKPIPSIRSLARNRLSSSLPQAATSIGRRRTSGARLICR